MSAFKEITSAIEALMLAEPPVAEHIYRSRDRAVPKVISTAINVQWDGGTPDEDVIAGAPVTWTSRFSIELYAKTESAAPDEAVDPLLEEVYARMAVDTTLGGLVDYIGQPALEAEYAADGTRTGWIRMVYPIRHETTNLKLEAR
jgi:hypothetical protein